MIRAWRQGDRDGDPRLLARTLSFAHRMRVCAMAPRSMRNRHTDGAICG